MSGFQSFFGVSQWFDRAVIARAARRGNPEDRGQRTEADVSPQIHEEFMKRGKA
jgi:hypothetical protein